MTENDIRYAIREAVAKAGTQGRLPGKQACRRAQSPIISTEDMPSEI